MTAETHVFQVCSDSLHPAVSAARKKNTGFILKSCKVMQQVIDGKNVDVAAAVARLEEIEAEFDRHRKKV